jgi:RNA polymerase primary sigma factor
MDTTIVNNNPNPMNEIVCRFQQGEMQALEPLIQENIRYVVTAAKDYQDKGVSLKDLISAGIRGLIAAAEHYNVAAEYRFMTYAIWWIRQEMLQAIQRTKTIVSSSK